MAESLRPYKNMHDPINEPNEFEKQLRAVEEKLHELGFRRSAATMDTQKLAYIVFDRYIRNGDGQAVLVFRQHRRSTKELERYEVFSEVSQSIESAVYLADMVKAVTVEGK